MTKMTVRNDIVRELIQADLHERFGHGWSIEVMNHPNPGKGIPGSMVRIRIRYGHIGDTGAVAANANMLTPHLRFMVEGKSIQEQVHEAIGNEWESPYYLNDCGLTTCQGIYEKIITNLDKYSWTEKNNPE